MTQWHHTPLAPHIISEHFEIPSIMADYKSWLTAEVLRFTVNANSKENKTNLGACYENICCLSFVNNQYATNGNLVGNPILIKEKMSC